MRANEEVPVFVVIDEMMPDGDNVLFASTNRKKAHDFVLMRFKPCSLRVEVWDGSHRMKSERVGGE